VNLVAAYTVLAVCNHPDGSEPLVQRDRGFLEDRADLDGELLFWMVFLALPEAASRDEAHVFRLAGWADRAIGEYPQHKEIKAAVGVSEVGDGLLEGFRFVCHEPTLANYLS
jgi:hypothetical protein